MGLKQYASIHSTTAHSVHYYLAIHLTIFLAETVVMVLMGWIMSPDTQGQLTGGDDATGNLPGLVFLMAFFSWIYSISVIGLWLVEAYNPPMIRALIQTFFLLPINAIAGFFLAYQTSWKVFSGKCDVGSVLCKSYWKTLIRIEGVTVFIIALIVILTLVDIVAAVRMWLAQRIALKKLINKTKKFPSDPSIQPPPTPQ
ncbi:hypothetical protein M408DRAFT_329371 [Serendipita vermifera MAFF 305830]|uniref:Uncharacterized protein n=1 Tax=Serendipita vermifera MAFF 305830 TaxID=933852 RepID=A0A0C2WR24_SERVB|nr:hypothetical protein M408DRAFT_329371 [Serendipita vermifera MAFF 305830]